MDINEYIQSIMQNEEVASQYPDKVARLGYAFSEYRKSNAMKDVKFNEGVGNFAELTNNLVGTGYRYEELEGKEHIVASCVMINEGVHTGSGGSVFYPKDELKLSTEAWNHKPVVVYHPEIDGKPVTACAKEVIENQKVGILLNTKFIDDGNKLVSELWLDVEKTNQVDKRILEGLLDNRVMEVSTGLFTVDIIENGKFNEEDFETVSFAYRPDHLALLPDKIGACSIADGAGFPRNEKTDTMKFNELSDKDKRAQLTSVMNDRYPDIYILDVYNDYFVFEYWDSDPFVYRHVRVSYTVVDDRILIAEDYVEVVKVTTYKDKLITNKGTFKMDKEKFIEALIANASTKWEDSDKEFLNGLAEDQLAKLEVNEEVEITEDQKNAIIEKATAELKKELSEVKKNQKQEPAQAKTLEELVANATPDLRQFVTNGINMLKSKKTSLVEGLVENSRCKFNKEQLEGKGIDELEILAEMVEVQTDFSGQASKVDLTANLDVEPLPDPWAESK